MVFALAAHLLKLERYREVKHGPSRGSRAKAWYGTWTEQVRCKPKNKKNKSANHMDQPSC